MKALRNWLFFFFLLATFFSCNNHSTLFELVKPGQSGIHFSNRIVEKDSVNPIDLTNIYNGGGVGVGDFNNDGLSDLFFSGNQAGNKLYINKGKFEFEDVTEKAKVTGNGKWCRGVSVVDINNDGWQDIYVSATILRDPHMRENLLYVNQGADKTGVPVFKEMAAEYGLNDSSHSTMAAFFDYDNDGDLDVYIAVNEIVRADNPSAYRAKVTDGSFPSTGRLYRNDWDSSRNHPVFKNVTKESGVTIEGFGHGVNISDFNLDGWKDIFVTNDFNSNDLLYINNHDGTFTDKSDIYFKHTSANGMGQDVVDINNDGLSDVVELDMNPEDNYRKKTMMNSLNYNIYQNNERFGYQYQYVRNSLQLNLGPRINQKDSIGDPVFGDIGFFSGISETDWSWTPLVTDFDNDGFRDIVVTNGYPKDVTDHDFIAFNRQAGALSTRDFIVSQIPEVKIQNYAFKNSDSLKFNNVTADWGLTTPSFSNGSVYVDLDNDGDMDMVVNNINDSAFVYRNTLLDSKPKDKNYFGVILRGSGKNINGLGAWIEVYYQGRKQTYEQTPYRGYLSSIDIRPHFGLGNVAELDSVVVKWPEGRKQTLAKVAANQLLTVDIKNADQPYDWTGPAIATGNLFTEVTDELKLDYLDKPRDYIDFNIQKLLPHKLTEYGPALAAGDLNKDGYDDLIVGGSVGLSPLALFQKPDGSFSQKMLFTDSASLKTWHDEGVSLFDADGDGDLDLYIASGGYEGKPDTEAYQDHFYTNDGKGNFTLKSDAIPLNFTSKSCVRIIDFDQDGDLDLFLAGRVRPSEYPIPVSSYIYRNDTKDGVVKFTDVTESVAPALKSIGLVCDALWTDFDNDGWQDLILAGEWMPITFLKKDHGKFSNITATSGVADKKGWWTSIAPGDFDNDGDIDYIVGNLGLNSFFKASEKYPLSIYAKDFDNNRSFDAFITLYLPTSQFDTAKKEYPAHNRDDMIKQMISFRSKFQSYKTFAEATFDKMFTPKDLEGALKLQANYLSNSFLRNDGGGKFTLAPLAQNAQFSCLNGMVLEDFDGDGNLDVLAASNDFSTEVSIGRYDACNGVYLKGDGKGNFAPLSILQSGWFVPGNGKALVKLKGKNGKFLVAVSQNKGRMKLYELKKGVKIVPVDPGDASAIVKFKNGTTQKREFYYGASFLSQSSRFLNVDSTVSSITIKDSKGKERQITL